MEENSGLIMMLMLSVSNWDMIIQVHVFCSYSVGIIINSIGSEQCYSKSHDCIEINCSIHMCMYMYMKVYV